MNEMDRLIDVLDSLRDDKNFGSDDAQNVKKSVAL